MKTSSAKAKARRLQTEIVKKILSFYPKLTENDVRSVPMGITGSDIQLSEEARNRIGCVDIEAKNQESLNIWAALEQVEERAGKKFDTPIVVFKRNGSRIYAALSLDDLLFYMSR